MNKPLISICIPAYREPELLKRSLDSLKSQSFKDFEIVVTDDSGNESVSNLVSQYKNILNLNYIYNKVQLGSPGNWNKALEVATGLFRVVLHHDDWFSGNDSLETIARFLKKNPDTDLLFLDYWNVSVKSGNKTLHSLRLEDFTQLKQNPYSIFPYNLIGPPSSVMFREDIQEFFDTRLKWVVDIDQYLRLLKKSNRPNRLGTPVVYVTWESVNQATHACQGKPEVELFEWPYLAQKIFHKRKYLNLKQIIFFKDLFRVQNVYDAKSVEAFGVKPLIWPLKVSLVLAKLIRLIKGK